MYTTRVKGWPFRGSYHLTAAARDALAAAALGGNVGLHAAAHLCNGALVALRVVALDAAVVSPIRRAADSLAERVLA